MMQQFNHGYALIIGVDRNNLPRLALPTVAKDVQAFYEVLTHPQRCGYAPENVQLLYGDQSTQKNILEALFQLQEKVQTDPEATAVVYYSGHGMVDTRTNQYYLIPYDIQGLGRVRIDAIKAKEFTEQLDELQPKRLLVILDCCHAAGLDAKDIELGDEAAHLARHAFPLSLPDTKAIPTFDPDAKNLAALATGDGRAVLNSSTGAESSYIRQDGKMSVFTYHLIEALTGHAPYVEGDATVLVTDVMSYVTRRVAETARQEGRQQTPVMRTTGVFPVALILGGEGVAKGMAPPDPLEELPPAAPAGTQVSLTGSGAAAVGEGATAVGERGVNVSGNVGGNINTGDTTTTFNQQGQTVHGPQINPGRDAHIDHIGNKIDTAGGDYVGGNKNIHGDEVAGNKVGGDNISVGNISGAQGIAIGRGARANYTNVQQGLSEAELARLFAPLSQTVVQSASVEQQQAAVDKVESLKAEVSKGDDADDEMMAGLVQDIAELAPGAVESLVGLFTSSVVAKLAGGTTKFVVGRLHR